MVGCTYWILEKKAKLRGSRGADQIKTKYMLSIKTQSHHESLSQMLKNLHDRIRIESGTM